MTEDVTSTPGWVDERLDRLFSAFPQTEELLRAREAYALCLASHKQSGTPSDKMGEEFSGCRVVLQRALNLAHIRSATLDLELEALEAEIAIGS